MVAIYLCPSDKRFLCRWEGQAKDIKGHFVKEHFNLLHQSTMVDLDIYNPTDSKLMVLNDDTIFLVQTKIDRDRKMVIQLRYLGNDATNYTYDISVELDTQIYTAQSRDDEIIERIPDGYRVDITHLEDNHGKFLFFPCQFFIRNSCRQELKINNAYVEENACDEVEEDYLNTLSFLDNKLKKLKADEDLADGISFLDFSILEKPFTNPNAQDSPELIADIYESVLSCTSCRIDMIPPIYLCKNGHSICMFCRQLKCRQCNGSVGDLRNVALEEISRRCKHPCKYSTNGCLQQLAYDRKREHEAVCTYCEYRCMQGCRFESKFDSFVNHLRIFHGSVRTYGGLTNEFPKDTEFYVVDRRKGIFYCRSFQLADSITWTATFCGPRERLFFCELYFKGAKIRDPIFFKRDGNRYEVSKTHDQLKKLKAKEKYAILTITSYDN